MEAAQQRGSSGRLPIPECPRSFLDSIPSPIAPAPPGSLGYVITKEHVEEMRRMEKLCEDKEEKLHREYKPVFLPVDDYLSREINCELINVDIRSYPWKNTPFGRLPSMPTIVTGRKYGAIAMYLAFGCLPACGSAAKCLSFKHASTFWHCTCLTVRRRCVLLTALQR